MRNRAEERKRNLRAYEQRCIQCGGFDSNILLGRKRCMSCTAKNSIRREKLREERRSAGLCVYCGKRPAEAGLLGCRECVDKIAFRQAKFRESHGQNAC